MDFLSPSPTDARRDRGDGRARVPMTVLAPELSSIDVVRRFAVDPSNLVIASCETLAAAGLLGLIRVGRALVTTADVTSRTPGCECCRTRVDLADAVRHGVLRRSAPRRVVLVVDRATTTERATTGAGAKGRAHCVDDDPASDVVTCVHTLQAESEIERLTLLDGVVVEVDACAASTRLACGLELWSGQTEAALAIADRIVLTGSGLLTASARSAVRHEVRMVNRVGRMVSGLSADDGRADVLFDLVDIDAWEQAPSRSGGAARDASRTRHMTSPASSHATLARSERHGPPINTVVLTRSGVLDPDSTDAWLDQVVAEAPSRLLRFQGALRVTADEPRVCVRGSRSVMRSRPEVNPDTTSTGAPAAGVGSVVVMIGRELDRDSLAEGFDSIEATR